MKNKFKTLWFKVKELYSKMTNNIIFIPAIFGTIGFVLGMIMAELESWGISKYLIEKAPFLVINNYDTATTLLSYQSGSIISIMVFSFSMVMVLLNQAASRFSPRVLPGLITVKKHQYILGLYLLSFFYNTFIMIDIKPTTDKYQLPGFSVLLGIVITTFCLFAFVYFIDSISKSIQLNTILDKISTETIDKIEKIAQKDRDELKGFDSKDDWHEVRSTKTGYYRSIKNELLLDFCIENNLKVHVLPYEGSFLIPGVALFRCSQKIDEEQEEALISYLEINREGENVKENYVLGFKQITEIAARALSPGVNDPGSAISAIDFLTEMLAVRMGRDDERYLYDENDQAWVKAEIISFQTILYQLMLPFRTYGKGDLSVSQRLLVMLKQLKHHPNTKERYQKYIDDEIKNLRTDVLQNIENERDRTYIENF